MKRFKEIDSIVTKNDKLYHDDCLIEMEDKTQFNIYEKKYSHLLPYISQLIRTEGEEVFAVIDKFDWIILSENTESSEMIVNGYNTEEQVKKAIVDRITNSTDYWNPSVIFHKQKRYLYNHEITITLTPNEI
jgi:hypothetical protein